MKSAYDIIIKPVLTEKSYQDMADKKFTFQVDVRANKTEIKQALESIFEGVKVDSVNTMRTIGKIKRQGRTSGRTPEVKKALFLHPKSTKSTKTNIMKTTLFTFIFSAFAMTLGAQTFGLEYTGELQTDFKRAKMANLLQLSAEIPFANKFSFNVSSVSVASTDTEPLIEALALSPGIFSIIIFLLLFKRP